MSRGQTTSALLRSSLASCFVALLPWPLFIITTLLPTPSSAAQRKIDRVELMPNLPQPFKIKDWKTAARDYDQFVFDFTAKGEFLPLIWWDNTNINIKRPTFGLPSYVGDPKATGSRHEGINTMGALLGATVAGIDKSNSPHNFILAAEHYFNIDSGENLVLNSTRQHSGGSFWYELWPHVLFYALAERYPNTGRMEQIIRITADRWYDASLAMGGNIGIPNFDHTAFKFATMQPVDNGKWKEPDAAAGIAWLEYMAYTRAKDPKHLEAADWGMQFLHNRPDNPFYEVLLPYGAYLSARMNAELGRNYDTHKFINWCFGISKSRGTWGIIAQRWGDYDCHGLVGSIDDGGGYAFAMNTYATAAALTPLVRYDDRYARAVGKWMLNLANASRLFFPDELPESHQSSAFWKADPKHVIGYEGLRKSWLDKSPYATGDVIAMKWGPKTDLGLYGSSYIGLLAGLVSPTNEPGILQLDLLATDFFHGPAYPSYLYYNPNPSSRTIRINVGSNRIDLYDAASNRFLSRNNTSYTTFSIPPDSAIVLVLVPANASLTTKNNQTLADNIPIDFRPD